ncbi:Dirigent protein 23 [Linum grandiflorum]
MVMSYGFIDGPYNGSSISIMGKNPTGVFRMARGYAAMKTVSVNAGGDAVVFYNVTVYTPASN